MQSQKNTTHDDIEQPLVSDKSTNYFGIDFSYDAAAMHARQISCDRDFIARCIMLFSSLPAGTLYIKYAAACVELPFCEKPIAFMSNSFAEKVIYIISGGGGFSAAVAALGFAALPKIKETFAQLGPRAAKAMVAYCLLYVSLQWTREVIGALGAFKPGDNIAAAGNLITVLFPPLAVTSTALNNAAVTFPKVLAVYNDISAYVQHRLGYLSSEEFAKRQHDKKQLALLKKRVEKKWQAVLANLSEFKGLVTLESFTSGQHDALKALFHAGFERNSSFHRRLILSPIAFTSGTAMLAAGAWNTYQQTDGFGAFVLTLVGVPSVMRMLFSFWVNSDKAIWHFHPFKTAAAFSLTLLWQMYSYAQVVVLISKMTEKDVNLGELGNQVAMMLGMLAIVTYHTEAFFNILRSSIRSRTTLQDADYIFKLEENVRRISEMPLQQYQRYLPEMSDEQKKMLGITEAKVQPQLPPEVQGAPIAQKKERRKERWCLKWCSFFCGNKKRDQVVDEPYQAMADKTKLGHGIN